MLKHICIYADRQVILENQCALIYKNYMDRKHFTTSLDEKLLKEIKKLAIDLDKPVNVLLEEGMEYLLKKYAPKDQFKKK
jgi:hypothetical protein